MRDYGFVRLSEFFPPNRPIDSKCWCACVEKIEKKYEEWGENGEQHTNWQPENESQREQKLILSEKKHLLVIHFLCLFNQIQQKRNNNNNANSEQTLTCDILILVRHRIFWGSCMVFVCDLIGRVRLNCYTLPIERVDEIHTCARQNLSWESALCSSSNSKSESQTFA